MKDLAREKSKEGRKMDYIRDDLDGLRRAKEAPEGRDPEKEDVRPEKNTQKPVDSEEGPKHGPQKPADSE